MSPHLLLPIPGNEALAQQLAQKLSWTQGGVITRKFPDGETYLKLEGNVQGAAVALVCTLDHPDEKILELLFVADAARDLGATSVGLVAPYLAYMRQDRRFQAGEAVTSRSFAGILSGSLDWLVTIDPHLHRYKSLSEIYSIPAKVLHAGPLLSEWIARNVPSPILIGPDSESLQWVSEAADRIGAPHSILEKQRLGDRSVSVRLPENADFAGRTPVLVDDIISSGDTMLEAIKALEGVSAIRPVCVVVHALFAPGAQVALAREAARIVTCNTVVHDTNAIDITDLLVSGIRATAG